MLPTAASDGCLGSWPGSVTFAFDGGTWRVFERVVDLVYEASVIPERWEAAIEAMTRLMGFAMGYMYVPAMHSQRVLACQSGLDLAHEAMEGNWLTPTTNLRLARAMASGRRNEFLTDLDVLTVDEALAAPVYTQLLHRHGLGWCIGGMFTLPGDEMMIIALENRRESGPPGKERITSANAFAPHLRRAIGLAANAGPMLAAASSMATLEAVGMPACLLTDDSRVAAANRLFTDLAPLMSTGARDRLVVNDRDAHAAVLEAIDGMSRARRRRGQSPRGAKTFNSGWRCIWFRLSGRRTIFWAARAPSCSLRRRPAPGT